MFRDDNMTQRSMVVPESAALSHIEINDDIIVDIESDLSVDLAEIMDKINKEASLVVDD